MLLNTALDDVCNTALAASQVYTKPKLNLPSDYSCA